MEPKKNDTWRKRAIRLRKRLVGRFPSDQITAIADELRLCWAEGVQTGARASITKPGGSHG